MRIRQIKPGWWLDKDLRKGLSAEAREFYIGLWMLADDDGWLVWDIARIAAELYPYDSVKHREARVQAWAERLQALCPTDPHLVVYECGHGRVPKLADHQKSGGRPVFTTREAHRTDCARVAQEVMWGRERNGRERNGSRADPDASGAGSGEGIELLRAVASGLKP